jgi:transcriptional regulator GlxA family with amidase domain
MNFAFLLYPGVEPIDLAALGVVSMARRVVPQLSFRTVAKDLGPCELANGLRVLPDVHYAGFHGADVLLVPGGPGWKAAAADADLLQFLRRARAETLCSLCTAALLLAAAGRLDGRRATTKVEVVAPEEPPLQVLSRQHPDVDVRHALVVDDGAVVSGGGVALCIDTVLHLLHTRIGAAPAAEVARILEYAAAWEANRSRLPVVAGENYSAGGASAA